MSTGTRVLGSDAARAVGRFDPNGTRGYRAKTGGPLRATRDEAEADHLAHLLDHIDTADATTMTVLHDCTTHGRHVAALPVRRASKLGCGCIRYDGTRCDGTAIEHIVGTHCNPEPTGSRA